MFLRYLNTPFSWVKKRGGRWLAIQTTRREIEKGGAVPARIRGRYAPFLCKPLEMENKNKEYYRLQRFKVEDLQKLQVDVRDHAFAIGGLPQTHAEVFQKRGWLLPYLFAYDTLLHGRWDYWFEILHKGTVEGSGPIPTIEFLSFGEDCVDYTYKMLSKCLDHHDSSIDKFADWLLWGLGREVNISHISPKLNQHYYEKFDLFLVLTYPTDYLSQLLCDESGKGYKQGLGYYPTPFSVSVMMTKMTFDGLDAEVVKLQSVCDPCVGCGALLLPASNYALRGYGQDISSIAVKLCEVQMHWYAPWYARPNNELKGFDIPAEATGMAEVSSKEIVLELDESLLSTSTSGQVSWSF